MAYPEDIQDITGVPKKVDLYRNQLALLLSDMRCYAFENIIQWLMNDRSIHKLQHALLLLLVRN